MRRTKIIATLGPATSSPEMLSALIQQGVNVFRFNMSHAPHQWVRDVSTRIREVSAGLKVEVALLLDTQGPAIRTAPVPETIQLKVGDILSITVGDQVGTEAITVGCNYPDLVDDVELNQPVIVDNGNIRLLALEKRTNELVLRVLTPGPLGSRRHINLPGVKVKLPALTEKDLADIELAFECNMEFISMSFVREADDIKLLRGIIADHDQSTIRIVAKIEDQLAVKNLEEIIAATDVLMIARGDLGIEVPYEELPIIQRRAINLCLLANKGVIVATHLLESMIVNPSPTRAEITDVANAVFEHADAIMLSGETTTGSYPLECVEIMDRIAKRIELSKTVATYLNPIETKTSHQRMRAAAVYLANEIKAAGICVLTHSGKTARFISGLRPQVSPIFAFTPHLHVCRQLAIDFGVAAHVIKYSTDPNENLARMQTQLKELHGLKPGDALVVFTDLAVGGETLNAIHIHVLK